MRQFTSAPRRGVRYKNIALVNFGSARTKREIRSVFMFLMDLARASDHGQHGLVINSRMSGLRQFETSPQTSQMRTERSLPSGASKASNQPLSGQ